MNDYTPDIKMTQQIQNNFTYHPPKEGQQERYIALREAGKNLAYLIVNNTKFSREQALALSRLEEVIFWSNAAIARNE